MTAQRIRRLRKILTDSRSRLLEKYPFFAMMLMYLRFVADKQVRRMTTNGICIYFNPDFLERLRTDEVDFLLCHQMIHLVRGDIWRANGGRPETFHYACDILSNKMLAALGFSTDRYPHIGAPSCHVHYGSAKGDSDTPEAIVSRLLFYLESFDERVRREFLVDSTERWMEHEDVGNGGVLILDFDAEHWLSEVPEEETPDVDGAGGRGMKTRFSSVRNRWKLRFCKVKKALENARGTAPGGYMEELERLVRDAKPRLDWKKLLQSFVQEDVKDYTFTPPDRRMEGEFFLPDFNIQEGEPKNVLFMVDTSGSFTTKMLSEAYAEIRGAVEQAEGGLVGRIGFFDTCVHKVETFSSVDDLCSIRPVGGGGTDFFPVFEYLEAHLADQRPACMVILTDGYAEFPSEAAAHGVPVLWILNNARINPPFGRVIRLLSNEVQM